MTAIVQVLAPSTAAACGSSSMRWSTSLSSIIAPPSRSPPRRPPGLRAAPGGARPGPRPRDGRGLRLVVDEMEHIVVVHHRHTLSLPAPAVPGPSGAEGLAPQGYYGVCDREGEQSRGRRPR